MWSDSSSASASPSGSKDLKLFLSFMMKRLKWEPDAVVQVQKCGFKTIQCDPLQMGKGIVDCVFFGVEEIFAVPKIQFALKNEGTKFLWIRSIKWVGFPELGFGCGSTGLDKFIDSHNEFDSVYLLRINCSWSTIGSSIIHGIDLYWLGLCRRGCRLMCSWHGSGGWWIWWCLSF